MKVEYHLHVDSCHNRRPLDVTAVTPFAKAPVASQSWPPFAGGQLVTDR
jgi:hypothetical protein